MVLGEKQQSERHLRDDEGLAEREQLCQRAAGASPATVRDRTPHGRDRRDAEDDERNRVMELDHTRMVAWSPRDRRRPTSSSRATAARK
jgi:hypothetical protein